MQLRGRQTQFYIDLIYGLGFAVGFGYLLIVGMNPLVAAFQSGLVLGYFLRVWENMSIYERILQEEVAAEAEEAVAHEIEDTMPGEVEDAVAEEFEDTMPEEVEAAVAAEVEGAVADEAEAAVPEEVTEEVEKQVAEEMADEIKERVGEEMEERLQETGEHVPEHVRKKRTAHEESEDNEE
jgi:uncharacterized membrane protein YheB (UPF0754 family)